jgi:hypothetical protein
MYNEKLGMLKSTVEGIAQNMGSFEAEKLAVVIIIDGLFIMDKSVSDFLEDNGRILIRKKIQLVFDFQNSFIFREIFGVLQNNKFKEQIERVLEKLLVLFRRHVMLKRDKFELYFQIILRTLKEKLHRLEHQVFLKNFIKHNLRSSRSHEVEKVIRAASREKNDNRPVNRDEANFKNHNEFRELESEIDKLFGILESDLIIEIEENSQRSG